MTRVYAFVAPPSTALRAALTERWGAHGDRWGWWAPEGAEVPHDTVAWLVALGLAPSRILRPRAMGARIADMSPNDYKNIGQILAAIIRPIANDLAVLSARVDEIEKAAGMPPVADRAGTIEARGNEYAAEFSERLTEAIERAVEKIERSA